MAVKPLDWIGWRRARERMPEIWRHREYRVAEADQAMVNSLRRGNVHFRGTAWGYRERSLTRQPLALRDIVAGLLSLPHLSLFAAEAEYESTEWVSVLFGDRMMGPRTIKKIAWLDNAELAWDEFRDDLIRFELPAGVKPKGARKQRQGTARRGHKYKQGAAAEPSTAWRATTEADAAERQGTAPKARRNRIPRDPKDIDRIAEGVRMVQNGTFTANKAAEVIAARDMGMGHSKDAMQDRLARGIRDKLKSLKSP
jgi:hypothetical protein